MRHTLFADQQPGYEVAILIKDSSFIKHELLQQYVVPLGKLGIHADKIIGFDLEYPNKKVNATVIKNYLAKLLPALAQLGIKYIYCADAAYFKALTKETKADSCFGYVMPCNVKGFEHFHIVLGLNYGGLVYNPNQYPKLDMSLNTLASHYNGKYVELGTAVFQHEDYPASLTQIEWFLNSLHKYPTLTCDIEAFSLELFKAGIGSIAFAWDEHCGGAFLVDYVPVTSRDSHNEYSEPFHGISKPDINVRKLLRRFFEKYQGNLKFHNASYDVKVLIVNLFMRHPQDYEGMLLGLEIFFKHIDDTKVIAYLALNTTADISLSLKDLAHEYLGNYAQEDIKDIRLIPPDKLLRYNLTDCIGTWYVYKKYYPVLLRDQQENIYKTIMLPSLRIVAQMEIVGMPIDPVRVQEAKSELSQLESKYMQLLEASPVIQATQHRLQLNELVKINAKLKVKQHGIDKVADYVFNPNSNQHLQVLLYEVMMLPIIETTATRLPATGGDVLEKLKNHTSNAEYTAVLDALIGLSKVMKILTSFIPAFENATPKADGMSYLHANFNVNGTLSGRMSCSSPNLHQIPSGSEFGKLIKSCFKAPKGWLFAGADFASLEDRINALLTKDPNKLRVYAGSKQYNLTINGVIHRIREDDVVNYEGQQLTGLELYEKLQDSPP